MLNGFSFIHTADWHFWDKHKYSINNSRLKILERNARKIIKYAIKCKIKVVFIAGDITHTYNPDERILKILSRIFKLAIDNGVMIRIITGNHDTDGLTHSLESLQNILSSFNTDMIKIYSFDNSVINCSYREYFTNDNATFAVTYIPYQRDMAGAITSAAKMTEQFDKNFTNILIAHCPVNGAIASTGKRIKSKIKRKLFGVWDYIALGDYHKHQKLANNMYYSGSIIRINKGERNDQKSFIYVTMTGNKKGFSKKRIRLDDIELISYKIKYESINGNIEKISKINGRLVSGAIINLLIYGDIGTGEKLVKLKNALYKGGAAEVYPKFLGVVKPSNKNYGESDIELSFDIAESCERYAKRKNVGKESLQYGIDKINLVR
jgi:DNA repair exonuclease SbcCD nuclease subunit